MMLMQFTIAEIKNIKYHSKIKQRFFTDLALGACYGDVKTHIGYHGCLSDSRLDAMLIMSRSKFSKRLGLLISIAVIALIYTIILVLCIFILQYLGWNDEKAPQILTSATIATALGGAVSAGGLLSLAYASKSLSDSDTKAAISSALRANELHAEFASNYMWDRRDKAWKYLSNITQDREKFEQFARMYVLDGGDSPAPLPDKFFSDDELREWGDNADEYDRCVAAVIGFYARLYSYVYSYTRTKTINDEDLAIIIGPFSWGYWRKVIIPLANMCEFIYSISKINSLERPYFIDQMRNLDSIYERVIMHRKIV